MTNTINNVPREMLERVLDYDGAVAIRQNARHELRALLSAPSPADVDGGNPADSLDVVGYLLTKGNQLSRMPAGAADEPLCRLSDAKAIIDGLRGEVAECERELDRMRATALRLVSAKISSAGFASLLKESRQYVAYAFSEGMDGAFTLGVDIDAALAELPK